MLIFAKSRRKSPNRNKSRKKSPKRNKSRRKSPKRSKSRRKSPKRSTSRRKYKPKYIKRMAMKRSRDDFIDNEEHNLNLILNKYGLSLHDVTVERHIIGTPIVSIGIKFLYTSGNVSTNTFYLKFMLGNTFGAFFNEEEIDADSVTSVFDRDFLIPLYMRFSGVVGIAENQQGWGYNFFKDIYRNMYIEDKQEIWDFVKRNWRRLVG